MKRDITKESIYRVILAGRTFDQQLEGIRRDGLLGDPSVLRYFALRGLGIKKPREKAENVISFGCYPLFSRPKEILSHLKLLDYLGVEYSYLKKEYCCGFPLLESSTGAQRETVAKEAKDYLDMNIAAARELGAKNMVYSCIWCAYMAKNFSPQPDLAQVYALDILVDRFQKENLEVKPATIVGYYEGCHVRPRKLFPEVKFNWAAYREMLEKIKGLEIVDLPKKFCCIYDLGRIAEETAKRNLHTIICPCNGCRARLTALENVEIKSPQEILLEALK